MGKLGIAIAALALACLMAMPLVASTSSATTMGLRAVDLGTLGGDYSQAFDMNDLGVVVGGSWTTSDGYHAFKWSRATGMVDINPPGAALSSARAINDRGDIAGSFVPNDAAFERACLWKANGQFVDIGALFGGDGTSSFPTDINDHGCIVGRGYTYADVISPSSHVGHALLWSPSSDGYAVRDIGTLSGGSWAWAWGINDWGEVVGMSQTWTPCMGASEVHAFKWSAWTGMRDIWHAPNLNYEELSAAYAINDRGQVVLGINYLDDYGSNYIEKGYLSRRPGTAVPIGPLLSGLPAYARAENSAGDSAGAVWTTSHVTRQALLLPQAGRPVLLSPLTGGSDCWATAISDRGQIAGVSLVLVGGGTEYHAALWTR